MVPAAVPSGILFFAKSALVLGIFCPIFGWGVQNRSRTMFTSGEVLVKILQITRNIVTRFAHKGFLGIFGDFWIRKLIVRVSVRRHGSEMINDAML
jgi:hypothetical protein